MTSKHLERCSIEYKDDELMYILILTYTYNKTDTSEDIDNISISLSLEPKMIKEMIDNIHWLSFIDKSYIYNTIRAHFTKITDEFYNVLCHLDPPKHITKD